MLRSDIPTMTTPPVHEYLEQLGSQWTGRGVAMELGCWLGASSVPLLRGLVKAGYDKQFWAFDKWTANKQQVSMAKERGVNIKLGEALLSKYSRNVSPIYHRLTCIAGMIPSTLAVYIGSQIEICIFDAPKCNPIFIDSIRALYKYWIPGVTILGLLDYNFYKSKRQGYHRQIAKAPLRFIEENKECFQVIKKWDDESPIFFKYVKLLTNI